MLKSALFAAVVAIALPTAAFAQGATSSAPGQSGSRSMTQGSAGTMNKPSTGASSRSAKSLECSAQADKQGLHGKARKTFRDKCKRGA
jgi:hypothetical protein